MPDDPTGNIAELINNVFDKNSKAIDTFSSAIGSIADVAGVIGAVGGVIGIIGGLFSSTSDPLQAILDQIQRDFASLFQALKARWDEEDWKQFAILLSSAEAVFDILPGLITAQPPLTDEDRLDHIAACLAPLNALSDGSIHAPSPFFLMPYSTQVYWTDKGKYLEDEYAPARETQPDPGWVLQQQHDEGYGTQAPPTPPDDQIFSYVYVLPTYLKAAFLLISVGEALFADFGKSAQRQQDTILQFAGFLASIHDLIVNGITELAPQAPLGWSTRGTVIPGLVRYYDASSPHAIRIVGLGFEWGAVEIYSGFSSIRSAEYRFGTTRQPYARIFQKLRVRALREMMAVYVGVGLPGVRNAVNSLSGKNSPGNRSRRNRACLSTRAVA